jgi:hypothetical protein
VFFGLQLAVWCAFTMHHCFRRYVVIEARLLVECKAALYSPRAFLNAAVIFGMIMVCALQYEITNQVLSSEHSVAQQKQWFAVMETNRPKPCFVSFDSSF